ncbi:twin-arginine translocase subunit TatC [Rubellimicrobium aerolatum]|uniref:Sec-independent protein translocase protein TatC n=1 Tax=Rubellimicrobium aerolatum TaxID=490979 RepID=A0ABW0SBL8_9RHOB|nr:twin-arginine translocase subunit TatC [Rubellimicrobium aerolatum]MBP1805905.1 sec-independent protein translocase protein TatC [Rubellimicrobium aerolatum]
MTAKTSPLADPIDEVEASSAPLIEHLAELRTRIIWSLLAFVVAMTACFVVWEPIYDFLTVPLCTALNANGQPCELVFLSLQEGFFLALSISMMAGLVLSFPVISYQLWRFVAPGLYKNEKGAFLPFLLASPIMFFLGAAFAYWVIAPMAFSFFLTFQSAGTLTGAEAVQEGGAASVVFQGSAKSYLSLTMAFIVSFGLCFQLPVLLTLLGRAGIVTGAGLARMRKYALVGILILAAIATPGPDVMSQVILFAVVYPLYEVSIWLVRRHERQVEAKMRAEGLLRPDETLYDDDEAAS